MLPEGRKHCQGLPPDVLSNLPDNVIDVILMCLPCKDGVRTSVLSKKWRYHWCRLAKFELDESLWRTRKDRLYPTVRLAKIVYQLLTHHEGPITKFKLRVAHSDLKECPEIDNFIYFLSRKGIQHLVLHLPEDGIYKLPSSLFICSQLRHLNLHDCLIHPPPAFKGFDRLVSLELCRVTISSELLGSLISHCPLLEQFVLKISESLNIIEINAPMLRSFDFTGSISSICLKNVPLMAKASLVHEGSSREAENFDYAKFFESCSSLEHLLLNFKYGKFFADETPTRLPFDLNCLKHLRLSNIVVKESYKLSCALCLIRSSPYLEYLEIEIYGYYDGAPESLELERLSDVTFNHLREVTLITFGRTTLEMQLIKLLLAKSPMLVKMLIYPAFYLETTSEILNELSKFGHASPKAVLDHHDAGVVESLELERFSDVIFNHLKEVKLKIFSGMTHEMQLIKLFLAKSPVLVRVLIDPSYLCIINLISLDRRSEIFAEFSNFFRASPKAEVVYMYLDNQTSRFNQIVNFD